jgi:hypothetical protein
MRQISGERPAIDINDTRDSEHDPFLQAPNYNPCDCGSYRPNR